MGQGQGQGQGPGPTKPSTSMYVPVYPSTVPYRTAPHRTVLCSPVCRSATTSAEEDLPWLCRGPKSTRLSISWRCKSVVWILFHPPILTTLPRPRASDWPRGEVGKLTQGCYRGDEGTLNARRRSDSSVKVKALPRPATMSELMSHSVRRCVPGRFDTRRYIESSGMHGHAGIYPMAGAIHWDEHEWCLLFPLFLFLCRRHAPAHRSQAGSGPGSIWRPTPPICLAP